MYVKISSSVSWRFHQKLLFYFGIASSWHEDRFFFVSGPEHFPELVSIVKENCLFKEALKLFPKSNEQHRVCLKSVIDFLLYTDVFTTVIMTVWLSTDSRGVDSQWWLPQTDWPTNPHTSTDQQSKWVILWSPNPPSSGWKTVNWL